VVESLPNPSVSSDLDESSGGVLFDAYVERCLYDPVGGFYAAGRGRAGGHRGDFITSPEVGPLFGAVIARAIDQWWNNAGRPSRFPIVDLGAGPGGMLRALELASPECARSWELIGVDRAAGDELPDVDGALVVANELLDNVPFGVGLRTTDGDFLLAVGGGDEVTPIWRSVERAVSVDVPVDRPFPVLAGAAAVVRHLLDAGVRRIVAFDYGAATTAELAERGGWLRTYREHQRGQDPFHQPGHWDITTDLAVDQLPTPSRSHTQRSFLEEHGIEELVDEGRAHWAQHAGSPDLAAMRMRSRVREAEALLDPTGLGSFLCLEWVGDDPAGGSR
jgi:SAM-dependent MidA family methyltransferase